MDSVHRLLLRDPDHPPRAVIARLHEELPGVEIGADGRALVFMSHDRDLAARVQSAVARVCGDPGWTEHFRSLDDNGLPVEPNKR
ncbi:MAG TPA: hypothetical protein VKA96_01290 [Solirubrobacteraceae bacterium]|jgi:hypothetical protein|nr:hypothetical protein [Solirubrobacteraceae bacterium]